MYSLGHLAIFFVLKHYIKNNQIQIKWSVCTDVFTNVHVYNTYCVSAEMQWLKGKVKTHKFYAYMITKIKIILDIMSTRSYVKIF
jgi:hypothetical protein